MVWINEGLSIPTGIEEAIKRPGSQNVASVYVDMLTIAADGNRVLTERLDRFVRADGGEIDALKVMGIFEVEGVTILTSISQKRSTKINNILPGPPEHIGDAARLHYRPQLALMDGALVNARKRPHFFAN